jgi:DNA integrity scanning protein DisA with diadenylate cyclase activity
VLRWASRARALRIVLVITALYAGVLVSRQFDLLITAWILQGAALISVALLVIVFQPEVRRALSRLDRQFLSHPRGAVSILDNTLAAAAFDLAREGVGALFVVTGEEPIGELLEGGTILGADLSGQLIEALFQKSSPLHDGAAVIEGARITQAGAVLPLTQRRDVPPQYGTRHRAAMGLAERTDALCIVVSEERSDVTLMRGRSITHMTTPKQLSAILENAVNQARLSLPVRVRALVVSSWRIKMAALGLAALIWSAAVFDPSSTIREIAVPIEFRNVPVGLDIVAPPVTNVSVELRGRTWLMNSNEVLGLVARLNLAGSKEGVRTIRLDAGALGLPPGVEMMRAIPASIPVQLVKRTPAR